MVLEKTLESHLDFKEINQSILKEINPEYSLEGLMLKLKLQYFSCLMWRADSLEKTWERLKAGGEGDDRGWDCWMASQTLWRWFWVNSRSWWWTKRPGVLHSVVSQGVGHNWVLCEWLNWTEVEEGTHVYSFSAMWGHREKATIFKPGRRPLPESEHTDTPYLSLPKLQNCEKHISVFKLLIVMAVWVD